MEKVSYASSYGKKRSVNFIKKIGVACTFAKFSNPVISFSVVFDGYGVKCVDFGIEFEIYSLKFINFGLIFQSNGFKI